MADRLPLTLATYRFLTKAATPLAPRLLDYRLKLGKEDEKRLGERRGEASQPRPAGPLVWIHGASVGELNAAIPLVDRIRKRDFAVLVTTGTVTSAEVAASRLPAGAIHQYVPLDLPPFVDRFLDHWRPDLILFVESDLWPNVILGSSRRDIPLIVVNGRMSQRSFNRWRYMPGTIEALLQRLDICLVRTTVDAERFGTLGAPRISTTGNIKLDVPLLPVDEAKFQRLRSLTSGRPIVAAASTHLGEDEAVIEAHRRLKSSFPGLLTILAPRHPERGAAIATAVGAAGLRPVQRSRDAMPSTSTDVYICDTLGELGLIYRLAPIVFMGGSLIPHGGQNPIEAVKFGAAILHGPHVFNFTDIYAALDQARGADLVHDANRLTVRLGALLKDRDERQRLAAAGKQAVDILAGALDRTVAALEPYFMQLRLENRDA